MTARVGDMGCGSCPAHVPPPLAYQTVFASGAETVVVNGQPATIITTIGISSCGHVTLAVNGSVKTLFDGQGDHRVGDTGVNPGSYVVVSGSPNVVCG